MRRSTTGSRSAVVAVDTAWILCRPNWAVRNESRKGPLCERADGRWRDRRSRPRHPALRKPRHLSANITPSGSGRGPERLPRAELSRMQSAPVGIGAARAHGRQYQVGLAAETHMSKLCCGGLWIGQTGPMSLAMAVSHAKRRAVHGAIREFLVRVLAAVGLVAGLLWALEQPTPTPSAACKQSQVQSTGGCFNDTLLSTLIPYITAMGIGVAVGALIGFLISVLMTGPPRSGRAALPARRATASSMSTGRWIIARYDGRCASCGSQITAGDRVHHRPRRTVCGRCG